MGLFDFFKKKEEPDYDPLNVKVTDIKKGFVIEYDLKSWIVKEEYEYDWGNNFFSKEFKLDSGDDSIFLSLEDDDELEISVSKKIRIRSIDEDLPEYIMEHEHPPKKIYYKGVKYLKDSENPGYFRDLADKEKNWSEFISWDYFDEEEKNTICIEQWGEKEFEASIGKTVKEFEISNILPAEK